MEQLTTVRAINKACLEQLKGGKSRVLCKVPTLNYSEPFTYQVLRARTVKGVLQVRVVNGWEVPLKVYREPSSNTRGPVEKHRPLHVQRTVS